MQDNLNAELFKTDPELGAKMLFHSLQLPYGNERKYAKTGQRV